MEKGSPRPREGVRPTPAANQFKPDVRACTAQASPSIRVTKPPVRNARSLPNNRYATLRIKPLAHALANCGYTWVRDHLVST